ncbi:MAG: plastocyanin/azurin family copper-binding protein, partial [Flavobacteriaceae bacterium]
KLDKLVMGHNFVLLKKGVNTNEFGIKASSEKENEYIPDGGNQVIAHTKLIGGGDSDTITFDAPKKGTYEFICSFPGHYMSMKGKLIIK